VARVGILGGTFNPPHVAHLVCATEAREQLGLDRVTLMVAGVPPHKEAPADPGVDDRLAMARLAAATDGFIDVSELEAHRPGPSYTVDTLRELHASQSGDELTFIVGGDIAEGLPTWREPETVLDLATLAVAERDGVRREELRSRLRPLRGSDRIVFIDVPRLDISSSMLRERVRAGRSIRHLVADSVADYIDQHDLYG
jgi:nicotinate-nucleotide adenylyltransferase